MKRVVILIFVLRRLSGKASVKANSSILGFLTFSGERLLGQSV